MNLASCQLQGTSSGEVPQATLTGTQEPTSNGKPKLRPNGRSGVRRSRLILPPELLEQTLKESVPASRRRVCLGRDVVACRPRYVGITGGALVVEGFQTKFAYRD